MKNLIKIISLSLLVIITLQGCGAKRMVKKATQFEERGMYTEATDYYFKALAKRSKHVDAIIGLKKNGKLLLTDLIKDFDAEHKAKNRKEAVYQYKRILDLKNNASRYGVDFKIPARTTALYKLDKKHYLNNLYSEADKLLDEGKFETAMDRLVEIEKFDANYRDIQDLKHYAKYEPIYLNAKHLYQQKKYRHAFAEFGNLGSYRDSENWKSKAQKEGTLSILVLPFYNNSPEYNLEFDVEDKLIEYIVQQQNPFLKIIENRQNFSPLDREEYHANKTGVYSGYKNKRDQYQAKALLIGEIVFFRKSSDRVKAEEHKGYEVLLKKVTNPTTSEISKEKEYKKIYYNEHRGASKVEMHFSYRLISTETGETLYSELIQLGEKDAIHYASFDGDYKNLIPGEWENLNSDSDKDYFLESEKDVNAFRDLFSARKKLTSIPELKISLIHKITQQAAHGINSYNPEK